MKRSALFYIHSFAGLLSGLFILLMSISGSVLVFDEELDRLQYPEFNTIASKPVLPVDSCHSILQEKYPRAQISNCQIAENVHHPFIFTVYDSSYHQGTRSMQVLMHPQTGDLLHTRGGSKDIRNNFMSWLTVFHNSFHLKKKGEWLLGFFAIVFMISLVTGFVLFRKKIVAVLSFRKPVYRKNNLHQVIGVYALLFNLVIAVTGFWMQRYVFKKEFYAAEIPYTPVLKASNPLWFSIDSSLAEAKKLHPGFTAHVIYFTQSKKGKTAVYGSRSSNSFIHSRKFADAVFLDSAGRMASTAFVTGIKPEDRYDIINAQVHYGRYGGLPVKILYSLFGVSGGLLSITGCILWVRRRKLKS
jgi:uncharacterized iron-regulated membrane protein